MTFVVASDVNIYRESIYDFVYIFLIFLVCCTAHLDHVGSIQLRLD